MQISSLVRDEAQRWNGNLPNSYTFSLEMRLLMAQSTQPRGKEPKGCWGGFPHQVIPLPRWQGMFQKMGGPGVPAAGELEGACRVFQGCHLETQARVSILQPELMNSHQEMNPRINENDTKLFITHTHTQKSRDSDACRKIPFKCTDAQR